MPAYLCPSPVAASTRTLMYMPAIFLNFVPYALRAPSAPEREKVAVSFELLAGVVWVCFLVASRRLRRYRTYLRYHTKSLCHTIGKILQLEPAPDSNLLYVLLLT